MILKFFRLLHSTISNLFASHEKRKFIEKKLTIIRRRHHLTFMLGKPMPTKKLAIQLTRTAIDIAAGLGPWENSSAVIIHGMDPGPTAKNTTKHRVDTTEM